MTAKYGRTITVALRLNVPDGDERTPEEIAAQVEQGYTPVAGVRLIDAKGRPTTPQADVEALYWALNDGDEPWGDATFLVRAACELALSDEQAGPQRDRGPDARENCHLHRLLDVVQELNQPPTLTALPFGLSDDDLVVDPGSVGADLDQALDALVDLSRKPEDRGDFELVCRSWMLLLDAGAGSYGECLDTALTWLTG